MASPQLPPGPDQPDLPGREGTDLDLDAVWLGRVRSKLMAWYEYARRDLPWRETRDPYRVLVSEMMLVQTTVAAVVPYYGRFLARFPTVQALAEADTDDVLKAWEGLGYYRRARQLQEAARAVVGRHGGVFPDDPDAVRALPGVGRYIAGAVLSFAFDRPAPIVEANTQRVLVRWLAWPGGLKSSATQARLWAAAGRLVPPQNPGTFNQAFMELGALICTPRAPRCLVCPVSEECAARREGLQDVLPLTAPKAPPVESAEACALVRRGDRYLVVRRGKGRLWEGFWEFPTVHVSGADPASRVADAGGSVELAEGVPRLTGVVVEVGPVVHAIRYGVTKHRVMVEAHDATPLGDVSGPPGGTLEAAWFSAEDFAAHSFGAATRRLIGWLVGR